MRHRLKPDYLCHLAEYAFRGEVFARDLARRSRMARIVGADSAQGLDRRRFVGETDQPGACWNEFFKAGELGYRRPPGGEIADRAVAEPSRTRADVQVLGDRELTAPSAHVAAARVDI